MSTARPAKPILSDGWHQLHLPAEVSRFMNLCLALLFLGGILNLLSTIFFGTPRYGGYLMILSFHPFLNCLAGHRHGSLLRAFAPSSLTARRLRLLPPLRPALEALGLIFSVGFPAALIGLPFADVNLVVSEAIRALASSLALSFLSMASYLGGFRAALAGESTLDASFIPALPLVAGLVWFDLPPPFFLIGLASPLVALEAPAGALREVGMLGEALISHPMIARSLSGDQGHLLAFAPALILALYLALFTVDYEPQPSQRRPISTSILSPLLLVSLASLLVGSVNLPFNSSHPSNPSLYPGKVLLALAAYTSVVLVSWSREVEGYQPPYSEIVRGGLLATIFLTPSLVLSRLTVQELMVYFLAAVGLTLVTLFICRLAKNIFPLLLISFELVFLALLYVAQS